MNSYQQVNPDDSIDRVALEGQVIQSSRKVDSCEFITQNAQVRDLLSQADRVAKAPATVLITGESGTGKEVLAKRFARTQSTASGGVYTAQLYFVI